MTSLYWPIGLPYGHRHNGHIHNAIPLQCWDSYNRQKCYRGYVLFGSYATSIGTVTRTFVGNHNTRQKFQYLCSSFKVFLPYIVLHCHIICSSIVVSVTWNEKRKYRLFGKAVRIWVWRVICKGFNSKFLITPQGTWLGHFSIHIFGLPNLCLISYT